MIPRHSKDLERCGYQRYFRRRDKSRLHTSGGVLAVVIFLAVGLSAQAHPDWTTPFPPHHVIGNIYYVGSQGLASFLITTSQGNILINSSLESSVPMIRESIEKLGFRFSDTKILLMSHAHWDHCAGSAQIKELTGAKYYVMDGDVDVVESGGKSDFQYGQTPESLFKPVKVDRVLHDGDQVRLGDTVLIAQRTPGHTKGTTTWTMQVQESGKTLNVVIVGSPNVNQGYKLVNNQAYPQIATDYEHSFAAWKALPCDVFLGAHGDYYGLAAKYPRLGHGENPFIDPQGYKSYIAEREHAFREELKKQSEQKP